jgi:cytosine/adenosine deaminase-related metal-dependent hydrolase
MSRARLAILTLPTLSIMACTKELARQEMPIAGPLRINNLTIVDPGDGSERPAMSILMDKGKIVSVMPTRDVPPGSPITTVDGENRFAVPGYNNMHSHALIAERPELLLATMLAEGVTGFR